MKMQDDCKDLICKNIYCISQGQGICMLHDNPKNIRNCVARKRFMKLQDPWININDKLPKADASLYLVYRPKIKSKYIDVWKWRAGDEQMNGITHWMPLPQIPKGPKP